MRVVIAAAVAIETVIGLSGVKDCVHKTHISLILWLSVVLLSINRVVCLERDRWVFGPVGHISQSR